MPDEPSKSTRVAQRLIPVAALAVLLPAMVPWWVVVLPRLDFDVDPRSPGADIITTLGPAGFGTVAVLGTAAALFALVVHGLAGGRFAWKSALLLTPGLIVLATWMPQRFENLWNGTGWAWGLAAGLAMLHLGQWPAARRWVSAALAGFAAMLLIEALNYRFVEHVVTVAAFEDQREVVLQARGWAEGSSEAQLYERRLRTNDAIGAIGLSNVLATFGAGMAAMGLGLLIGTLRPKRDATMADVTEAARDTFGGDATGRWLVGGAVFVAGAAVVGLTNSTAGAAALALGCVWVVALAVLRTVAALKKPEDATQRNLAILSSAVAAGCVALVYAGVAVRYAVWGVPGPDEVGQGIGGELSVLFRAQYWGAAWRMVTDSTAHAVVGVGPGGFGDAYLRFKSPLNPEEVTSAHGFAIDFVATLGVIGGGLWALVLLGWLARGAWGVTRMPDAEKASEPKLADGVRGAVYGLLAVGGALIALELTVAWAEASGPGAAWALAWRLAALIAFVLVGGLWWRFAEDHGVRVGLVAAGVAVLVHGSFDMALFQPTSAALVWAVLGLAGGAAVREHRSNTLLIQSAACVVVLVAGSLTMASWGLALLYDHASWMHRAAVGVRTDRLPESIESLRNANGFVGTDRIAIREAAIRSLEQSGRLAATRNWPAARTAWEDAVRWHWRELVRRGSGRGPTTLVAIDVPVEAFSVAGSSWLLHMNRDTNSFVDADTRNPVWRWPGGHRTLAALYEGWLRQEAALRNAGASPPEFPDPSQPHARGFGYRALPPLDDPAWQEWDAWRWGVVARCLAEAAKQSPTNVNDRVRLGDALLLSSETDRRERAADSYREALRLDDLRYLDPAKQLPEAERARIEAWLAVYEGAE
ncbi:MAG: hypothetical protein AAGH92_08215 [Planctomycetota bacterium]